MRAGISACVSQSSTDSLRGTRDKDHSSFERKLVLCHLVSHQLALPSWSTRLARPRTGHSSKKQSESSTSAIGLIIGEPGPSPVTCGDHFLPSLKSLSILSRELNGKFDRIAYEAQEHGKVRSLCVG